MNDDYGKFQIKTDFDFASKKCASTVLMPVYNVNSFALYTLLSSHRFAA